MDKLKEIESKILRLEDIIRESKKNESVSKELLQRMESDLRVAKEVAALAQKDPQVVEKILGALQEVVKTFAEQKPVTEVSIKNTGDITSLLQKLLEKDYPQPIKEVSVNNLPTLPTMFEVKGIKDVVLGLSNLVKTLKKGATNVFKAVVTGEVKITNKELTDAIPVRLVSKDLKYFYDAMVSVLGAGGGGSDVERLDSIISLLQGSSAVGDGTATVTTAGTRVQLSSQACKKVIIQAHESNTGTVVIGGATCVANSSGRRGTAIFPTQSQAFNVTNLNLLYIDSTANGDIVHYYYEN